MTLTPMLSPSDEERKMEVRSYKRPIREVANALSASKLWPAVFEAGASQMAAKVAIEKLRSLGFISDLGIAAIKAEEARK